jgi:hypothetical protein
VIKRKKNISGRGHQQCKGPETSVGLVCWRNNPKAGRTEWCECRETEGKVGFCSNWVRKLMLTVDKRNDVIGFTFCKLMLLLGGGWAVGKKPGGYFSGMGKK